MKRQIIKSKLFGQKSHLFELLFTIIPFLLWMGATYSRTIVIQPRCSNFPQNCQKESIMPIDQLSIGMENSSADEYSYRTQNFSGVLGFAVPTLWTFSQFALGRMAPLSSLASWGTDLLIILKTASWNGLLTELSHLTVQRPRPFVYLDPASRGVDPAHYTSFYSGHTSFAAAMNSCIFLLLWARGAPLLVLLASAIMGEALVFSTAYFRILAGRHFLTDVIFGAIAGSLVAWIIFKKNQSKIKN